MCGSFLWDRTIYPAGKLIKTGNKQHRIGSHVSESDQIDFLGSSQSQGERNGKDWKATHREAKSQERLVFLKLKIDSFSRCVWTTVSPPSTSSRSPPLLPSPTPTPTQFPSRKEQASKKWEPNGTEQDPHNKTRQKPSSRSCTEGLLDKPDCWREAATTKQLQSSRDQPNRLQEAKNCLKEAKNCFGDAWRGSDQPSHLQKTLQPAELPAGCGTLSGVGFGDALSWVISHPVKKCLTHNL